MFSVNNQSGRTRVNKIVEGKRRLKNTQSKQKKDKTSFERLLEVQRELFIEGYTLKEYKDYVQQKINKGCFHYQRVTSDEVDGLVKTYEKKIQMENNHYNEMEDNYELCKKRRKTFRRKRSEIILKEKKELQFMLIKELLHCNCCAVKPLKTYLKDDEQNNKKENESITDAQIRFIINNFEWKGIKKMLFNRGSGSYLIDKDMKWFKHYQKIESMNRAHIVNRSCNSSMNLYVFEKS